MVRLTSESFHRQMSMYSTNNVYNILLSSKDANEANNGIYFAFCWVWGGEKHCLLVKCMSTVFTYSSLEHVKLLVLGNFMNTKHFWWKTFLLDSRLEEFANFLQAHDFDRVFHVKCWNFLFTGPSPDFIFFCDFLY